MTDKMYYTDGTNTVGIMCSGDQLIFGPFPPEDPYHHSVYQDLVSRGVQIDAFVAPLPAPRSANGRQLRYALNAKGWRAAWDNAVNGTTKPDDRDYWQTLSSTDSAPEDNPKLMRLAALASINLFDLYTQALSQS